MTHGKWYCLIVRVVVRGKPIHTKTISMRGGVYQYETKHYYHFLGFSIRKSVILEIKEETKELRDLVEHLESLLN